MTKKIPKEKVDAEAKSKSHLFPENQLERKIFDLPLYKKDGSRDTVLNKNPYVVLKYFQKEWECFSEWGKDELSQFSNFLKTLSEHTWDSVYKSGGKGDNKAGLGYTSYRLDDMKAGNSHVKKVISRLDPEITLFELRVSQKMRVHGFQSQSAFFLILLDRGHKVFPE